MATYYWAAPSVAAFNSANWATSDGGGSGFGPPGSGDTAIFKGNTNSNQNCTITANFTISVLDMRNNYAGSFGTDGGSHTLTITGNCAFGCSAAGEVKLGTGASWDIGGDLYTNLVLGDLLPLTSIVKLTGSNNTILQVSSLSNTFYILQIQKTGAGSVQLQGSGLDCESLLIETGKFDANDFDITIADFFRMEVSTICQAGTGTWDVGGDWDTVAATASGSFLAENGEIQLTGSGILETYSTGWINGFNKLTISGTYTIPTSTETCIVYGGIGWLKVTSSGILVNEDFIFVRETNDMIIEANGVLTTNTPGVTQSYNPTGARGVTNLGVIDGSGTFIFNAYSEDNIATSGNYSVADIQILNGPEFIMGAGTWTTKNFEVKSSGANLSLNMETNDPEIISDGDVLFNQVTGLLTINRTSTLNDWTVSGDFTTQGTVTYNRGTAAIRFEDGNAQEYNCPDLEIENVVVDKTASTLTLSSNLSCLDLTSVSGNFDANDYDIISGNVDWNAGDLDMGTGTWTANGNFNVDDVDVTVSAASATLVMTGTSKTLGWRFNSTLGTLDIDTGASVTWIVSVGGNYGFITDVNLDGTLSITAGDDLITLGQVDINATGTLGDGNGTLWVRGTTAVHGITIYDGSLDVDTLYIHPLAAAATDLLTITGTYTATTAIWFVNNSALDLSTVLSAGPYTFDSPITGLYTSSTGKMTVNNTANANLTFVGGFEDFVSSSGAREWLKGIGLVKFTGGGSHNIEWNMGTVEDIEIDATGTYMLSDSLVTDSFLGTAGVIDFNGQTVQTIGDFTINSANSTGFSVVSDADAMNTANITVGNDFYVYNITFNATDTWYLDVQGSSALAFNVNVRYSDADAGTTIDATHDSNIDLGVNYNWDFGGLANIQSTTFHCFPWTRLTNRSRRGFRQGVNHGNIRKFVLWYT